MRNATAIWLVLLGLTLSCASSLRAQPTPPRYTVADSAAAFSAMVEKLISDDSVGGARASVDPSFNYELSTFPRVFVRIAGMPKGAWAKPSVVRLRAHHWFYAGRAMDSTRALAQRSAVRGLGLRSTPFPAELSLMLEFIGDTARVTEYWAWNTCEDRPGLLGIFFHRNLLARTTDGWRWVEMAGGGTIDALCH